MELHADGFRRWRNELAQFCGNGHTLREQRIHRHAGHDGADSCLSRTINVGHGVVRRLHAFRRIDDLRSEHNAQLHSKAISAEHFLTLGYGSSSLVLSEVERTKMVPAAGLAPALNEV